MYKKAFVVCYFGKFKEYFQLFLDSFGHNESFDLLLFTDNRRTYNYPKNVHVTFVDFQQIQQKIQSKFDFEVALDYPYKLCDFKPAYGYIFNEELKDYDFWGYTDTDTIFGNIDNLIDQGSYATKDKIGFLGHFTLFKNRSDINEAFKLSVKPEVGPVYRKVLSSNEIFNFDELFNNDTINDIFINNGFSILLKDISFNTYMKTSNIFRTTYNFDKKKFVVSREKGILVYDSGTLSFVTSNNGLLSSAEYAYVHFQARSMKMRVKNSGVMKYKIIPNAFEYLENDVSLIGGYKKEKKKNMNIHYFKLRGRNLFIKTLRKAKLTI